MQVLLLRSIFNVASALPFTEQANQAEHLRLKEH